MRGSVADGLIRRGEAGPEVRPQIEQAGYTVEEVLGDWLPESLALANDACVLGLTRRRSVPDLRVGDSDGV